jgi:uncharacterized membrane protein
MPPVHFGIVIFWIEYRVYLGAVLRLQSSYLYLSVAGMTGMCHHAHLVDYDEGLGNFLLGST